MTELQEAIDHFFRAPDTDAEIPAEVSPLFMVQTEVHKCFDHNQDDRFQAILPGLMAIFTGIDLLSQCYFGNLRTKSSAKRMKFFMEKYLRLTAEQQEALYRFRSALTHTYGMYSFDEGRKKEYRFRLLLDGRHIVEKKSTVVYEISVLKLKEQFFKALSHYHHHLQKSEARQQKFIKVYRKIGRMEIQGIL